MPHYPEHLRGFDYTGPHRYFLTICTHQRTPHFVRAEHVSLVCEQFLRASREETVDVIAYCFMRDHAHLLACGGRDDADLKRFVKKAKQYSGFYFRQRTGLRLWQRYSWERVLRAEEDTRAAARYTIENPVRAGLASSPLDYPFWGSLVYSRDELLEYLSWAA